jgi:hypothetical protein
VIGIASARPGKALSASGSACFLRISIQFMFLPQYSDQWRVLPYFCHNSRLF